MAKTEPFYIVGPTGSGKSAVALALAERWHGEIINADAFQVYCGMPIVTAGPTPEETRCVPHHLYATLALSEDYNVARYERDAKLAIAKVHARGRRPIIVGGSGLYIKALTHGLGNAPPAEPVLRNALSQLLPEDKVAWLQHIDPLGAEQTNLLNPRYVSRALEITLLSGIPMSVVKERWASEGPNKPCGVFLQWDRSVLYQRINQRVQGMVATGLLSEIKALPINISATASKAIGVREIKAHLKGNLSLEEAIAQIQRASRRFAKRQLSWFKRETVFLPTPMSSATSIEELVQTLANKE